MAPILAPTAAIAALTTMIATAAPAALPSAPAPGDLVPAHPAGSVRLLVRDSFVPGIPVLVRVELQDELGDLATGMWDAQATLDAAGGNLDVESVTLRNGVGSALVTVTGEGPVSLTASVLREQVSA